MNLTPLFPSLPKHHIAAACVNCGGDVVSTSGFTELGGGLRQLVCKKCAEARVGERMVDDSLYARDYKELRLPDAPPLVKDSTKGLPVGYRMVCRCTAVELVPRGTEGLLASTQRCWACRGLAFGLRDRQYVPKSPNHPVNRK